MPTSVEGAVVLALRIQEALPIVRLVGLLGVGVDEHLDVAAEEAAAHLEDSQVLPLDDEACERADDERGRAPIDELARGDLEGGAVQGADDDVADDVGALAHGRADVRAEVRHAEECAFAVLAHQHVNAREVLGAQLRGLHVAELQAGLDPLQCGEDDLRGVAPLRLGRTALLRGNRTNGRQAEASGRGRGTQARTRILRSRLVAGTDCGRGMQSRGVLQHLRRHEGGGRASQGGAQHHEHLGQHFGDVSDKDTTW
mmetsp:Transcript_102531/g.267336  ORF Transcript_102531/g.267336 Transcript_102531/m.267336 type:complete len:256 (-) Transcript_102531:51-818(-)